MLSETGDNGMSKSRSSALSHNQCVYLFPNPCFSKTFRKCQTLVENIHTLSMQELIARLKSLRHATRWAHVDRVFECLADS